MNVCRCEDFSLKDSYIKGMKYSYLLFYSAIAAVVQGMFSYSAYGKCHC